MYRPRPSGADFRIREYVLRSGDADDIRKLKLHQLVERLCRSKNIYPNMSIALSKPHSCDIERLISTCNLSHRHKNQNLYLYVHLSMETLEEWDPRPCIIRWLNQKERRKKTVEKAKRQRSFKGVFKEANVVNDESDDEEDEVDKTGQNSQEQSKKTKPKINLRNSRGLA